MLDCVKLEMDMAQLMAQQERSGFRFDVVAAERVRERLQTEFEQLSEAITSQFPYVPGKVFTPKRSNKQGYFSGAPMTKLLEFNPTSRQHCAWALQNFLGARFTKLTDTGKPKVDEACLSEIRDLAISQDNHRLAEACESFNKLLTLQKWLGQLSEGANSWFNTIEEDSCIHHTAALLHKRAVTLTEVPTLGRL